MSDRYIMVYMVRYFSIRRMEDLFLHSNHVYYSYLQTDIIVFVKKNIFEFTVRRRTTFDEDFAVGRYMFSVWIHMFMCDTPIQP